MKEIQFYVQKCHLDATTLRQILRNKFSDQNNYCQDLYNVIRKFKTNAQIENDAATLVEWLIKLQQEDSEWYFKIDFEGINNKPSKIFGCYQIKKDCGHDFMMLL